MATAVGKPTQEFVPIKEIRDTCAILKDGSLRAILFVSSLNFALKSQEEQQAILYQFQNLLNSLDFSIQIFIESRKLDIRPYLALLEQRQKEQVDDLMKVQIQEYIGFIKDFTETHNIMSKSFFIIVPYSPVTLGKGISGATSAAGKFFGRGRNATAKEKSKSETEEFEEHRIQLEQRVSVVEQGLTRCGIRAAELGPEEITELFYKLFNPGETEKPIKLTS
jgi:type IV secretory pathway VirB4 component